MKLQQKWHRAGTVCSAATSSWRKPKKSASGCIGAEPDRRPPHGPTIPGEPLCLTVHHKCMVNHHKWLTLLHPQATLHIKRCFLPILTASQSLVGTLCNNMHADIQLSESRAFSMSVALISLLWVPAPGLRFSQHLLLRMSGELVRAQHHCQHHGWPKLVLFFFLFFFTVHTH